MCDPVSITAAVSVAVSAAGAAYSASAQNSASRAQQNSNNAAISNQNAGFWARNADQQRQQLAEGTAQNTALADQASAYQAMRSSQSDATAQREATLAGENRQADAITQQADTQQAGLLASTSAPALAGAQAADAANRNSQIAPAALAVSTTSPFGANAGDATKQAFAGRMAEAADSVRTYGQRLAQVASYSAPLTTVGQAISTEQAGIMPVAQANNLLQSGQQIRLLPSQQAYQIAGSEGDARQTQIQSDLQGKMNVSGADYAGSKSVADLQQNNLDTIAQNKATAAQLAAQQAGTLGSLIGQAGNIGAYGATRYGPGLLGTSAAKPPVVTSVYSGS